MINAKKAKELAQHFLGYNKKQKEDSIHELMLQLEQMIQSAYEAGKTDTKVNIPYYYQVLGPNNQYETICLEKAEIESLIVPKLNEAGYSTYITQGPPPGTYYTNQLIINW